MKQIFKLLVAMGLIFALAACGDDPSPTVHTLPAPTATSAPDVATEPTATAAQQTGPAPTATAAENGSEPTATAAEAANTATEAPAATSTQAEAATPGPTEATSAPVPTVEIMSDIPEPVDVQGTTAATIAATDGYFHLQTLLSESEGLCLEGNYPAPDAILEGATYMDSCQNVTGQLWKLLPGDQEGYYKLQTLYVEAESRCLEGNQFTPDALFAGAAFMDSCQTVTGQQWKFVDAGDGTYRMQTAFQEPANKCFEGNRPADGAILGGAAYMNDCQDVTGQIWKLVSVPAESANNAETVEVVTQLYAAPFVLDDVGVYYQLQTLLGQDEAKCLEGNQVADNSVLGGAAFMDDCSGVTGQMWNFIPTDQWGYYNLQTQFLADQFKCFDGNMISPDAVLGGGAYMADCNGSTSQLWRLIAVDDGAYRLQTAALVEQDKCLEGNRRAEDAPLGGAAFMDTCQDVTGQIWQLLPVEGSQTNNTDDGGLVPVPSGETTAPATQTTELLFDPNEDYTISTWMYAGLCLGMASAEPDRTATTMLECAASPDQYWQITPAANAGYYYLSNKARGPEQRLDTAGTTFPALQPAAQSEGQAWQLRPDPANPGYYLLSTLESGADQCMAVDGSDENGGSQIMVPCGPEGGPSWQFTPVP